MQKWVPVPPERFTDFGLTILVTAQVRPPPSKIVTITSLQYLIFCVVGGSHHPSYSALDVQLIFLQYKHLKVSIKKIYHISLRKSKISILIIILLLLLLLIIIIIIIKYLYSANILKVQKRFTVRSIKNT